MQLAEWTYELPPAGAASEGVQDYEVRSADDAHAGVAIDVVRKGDDLFLVVDAGPMPPLLHRRIAVRWEEVAGVDHELLVVSLALDRAEIEQRALALDPKKAQRAAGADAARLTGYDAPLGAPPQPGPGHSVAEPPYALPLVVLVIGAIYSMFGLITVWIARGVGPWEYALLALPIVLTASAVALEGYRLYREPHVRAVRPGADR